MQLAANMDRVAQVPGREADALAEENQRLVLQLVNKQMELAQVHACVCAGEGGGGGALANGRRLGAFDWKSVLYAPEAA
eukprot:332350-Chlamydomonas_euryale.AAC.1